MANWCGWVSDIIAAEDADLLVLSDCTKSAQVCTGINLSVQKRASRAGVAGGTKIVVE